MSLLRSAAKRAVSEYFDWEDYQHGKPAYVREAMDNLESALLAEDSLDVTDEKAIRHRLMTDPVAHYFFQLGRGIERAKK